MGGLQIDGRVIEACQRGDKEAFRLLFEFYKDRVYSIAFHFTADETTAREVSQDVFLKLFLVIKQFRWQANFQTWLYRLVMNACIDEHRKRRRFLPLADSPEVRKMVERITEEEKLLKQQIADAVKSAIAELRPKLRMPILLRYIEGLSYGEIASVLDCSEGTVASRLNRGHKLLAQKLAHLRDTTL